MILIMNGQMLAIGNATPTTARILVMQMQAAKEAGK